MRDQEVAMNKNEQWFKEAFPGLKNDEPYTIALKFQNQDNFDQYVYYKTIHVIAGVICLNHLEHPCKWLHPDVKINKILIARRNYKHDDSTNKSHR